jgi:hypothetical protein
MVMVRVSATSVYTQVSRQFQKLSPPTTPTTPLPPAAAVVDAGGLPEPSQTSSPVTADGIAAPLPTNKSTS